MYEMDTSKILIIYVASLIGFLIIDFIWLAITNSRLYKPAIGHLMSDTVNFVPALLFYVFYVVGVVILAVLPGLEAESLVKTLTYAAVLGFVAYGTYDFTNFATLKDWPLHIVIIDVIWGTSVTAMTGLIGYLAGSRLIS